MTSQEKAVSPATLPFLPIQRLCSKLAKQVPMPQATELGLGYILRPLTSCQIISPGPPFELATTGLPALQASSMTMPKGSLRLGTQTTSQALNRSTSLQPF